MSVPPPGEHSGNAETSTDLHERGAAVPQRDGAPRWRLGRSRPGRPPRGAQPPASGRASPSRPDQRTWRAVIARALLNRTFIR